GRSATLQLCALPVLLFALSACGDDDDDVPSGTGGSGGSTAGATSGGRGGSGGSGGATTGTTTGGRSTAVTGGSGGKTTVPPEGGAAGETPVTGGAAGQTGETGGTTSIPPGGAGGVGGEGGEGGASGGTTGMWGEPPKNGVDPWDSKPTRGVVKDPGQYVSRDAGAGRFPLATAGKAAPIVVSKADFWGVQRTAKDFQADVKRVTDIEPAYSEDTIPAGAKNVILVGTLGKSPLIDKLVQDKKLDVSDIAGLWETFLIQVVENPMAGVDRALVITGSDQRGTSFGIYDVSKQIGVSPWYFWDDVPARKSNSLYVLPGHHTRGEPAVKYRGFFINDENPQLSTWAHNTFGDSPNKDFPMAFHHPLYEKVFELMLRIKANYLWPAVWGRAFAEDDPMNHEMAKAYGVVMGTSHEAPMMRGIEEWNRHAVGQTTDANGNITNPGSDPYGGNGLWRFSKNPDALKLYWADGIKRMVDQEFEGVVTLGMRGPGDVSLPVEDGIELMNSVIAAQRGILEDETGKPAWAASPQVWTLYKEVQDYWDKGMRVPEDVTVVWCDDNWGNMRELPVQSEAKRSGGYGLYYHFDYVGGGRNYKWVDTNLLPNIWEQLNLSYSYGVNRLWVVNVGDMKNEEHPLEFFMDYAWSPEQWPLERLADWQEQWAAQQFGADYAVAIKDILHDYSRLQSLRKPELTNRSITLNPAKDISDPAQTGDAVVYDDAASPFSLLNYRELETLAEDWKNLAQDAAVVRDSLPAELKDAYYQLVFYQVQATAYLYEHRLAVFKNKLYQAQGRASTNDWGTKAQAAFDEGRKLAAYYNDTLAGGKWKGWQTQPYIGYGDVERYGSNAGWQQPELNNAAIEDAPYPHIVTNFTPVTGRSIGVSVEGSDKVWPIETATTAQLPKISRYQTQPNPYIEIFNRGDLFTEYTLNIPQNAQSWLSVTNAAGRVGNTNKEVRAEVQVSNWANVPAGTTQVTLTLTGTGVGTPIPVNVVVENTSVPADFRGFVEGGGYVAMLAEHYSRKVDSGAVGFRLLPDIGRLSSGLTPFPVNAPPQTPGDAAAPHLEYDVYLTSAGETTLTSYLSPRNNVLHSDGLKYAVSIDNGTPEIVNITKALNGIPMNRSWERNTSDNVNRTTTKHTVTAGKHTIKFWMVDPTIIVQKLVLDTGGARPSYLGPPESFRKTN
ncbi:MAG TPA: glycosyl hydrolase 115 family protein, partial [Polyangiaceae bacterium]|nr:glycosyl hydrolase 115 family protein [Polyangiaceae bacterium]